MAKEVIASIYVWGAWHPVVQGTFRNVTSGPPALGTEQPLWTWLEAENTADRYYARSTEILGVMTRTEQSVS